jgi:hypothetical protein
MTIIRVGPHRLRHGDLMDGLGGLMKRDERADVVYVDPPWGPAALNYFQTINHQQTGAQRRAVAHAAFIDKLFGEIQRYAKGLVFVEYGQRWIAQVLEVAREHGLTHITTANPVYGAQRRPLHLHVFTMGDAVLTAGWQSHVDGTRGYQTVRNAVLPVAVPGGVLLDPCCGLGYSAKVALESGMEFRGNELNRQRLQRTINLIKATKT